ncbi:hypothetical protein OG885_42790 [Streptomyces sp. NBC_00028]|uniref:hypothetical protein n=1 Tax=Streptomyces sp. NBC_00028 TaxID=2975624 RepID=UPI003251E1CE
MSPEKRAFICAELCNYLAAAGRFERLDSLLTDIDFLAQRCRYDGVDGVLRDLENARTASPRPWQDHAPPAQFTRFLARSSHLLRRQPALIWQEALNCAEPAVTDAAEAHRALMPTEPRLRRKSPPVADHHTGQIVSLAFWGPDLLVSTTGLEVWAWDVAHARVRARFDTPPAPAKSLSVSPDRRHLAAGYGSPDPSPHLSGVRVWTRDGAVRATHELRDWVYTVRWRSAHLLVAGGGMPQGSEANGTIWRIDLTQQSSEQVDHWLADRPVVLTWDPVPGDAGQMMALTMDGFVLHLTPDYRPITHQEAVDLSFRLMEDGDYAAHDERMLARRPVVLHLAAPVTDTAGFVRAADAFHHANRICLLGHRPVPPEMAAWHSAVADGVYLLDLADGEHLHSGFHRQLLDAGFRALCLAVSPVDEQFAYGAGHGRAYVGTMNETRMIHQGDAPVTAVCFDDAAHLVAVGDASSGVTVYDVRSGEARMRTRRPAHVVAADADVDLVLFADRVEVGATTVPLPEGMTGIAMACRARLAVVLCHAAEAPAADADWLVIVDLRTPAVLVAVPVTVPHRDRAADATAPGFRQVEVTLESDGCRVYLASPDGVTSCLLLAPETHTGFVLPEEVRDRERSMTAIRVGQQEPDLACTLLAVLPEGVLAAYVDNRAFPIVTGELHLWTPEHSEVIRCDSAVTALRASSDFMVVGTEHGEAIALRRSDRTWHRLFTVRHPVNVTSVALAENLACSASRDGLIQVWPTRDGVSVLTTSLDAEPLSICLNGPSLSVVDTVGRTHRWDIENLTLAQPAPPQPSTVEELHLQAAGCIARAVAMASTGRTRKAVRLLDDLPEIPQRPAVKKYWTSLLRQNRL